MFYSSPRQRYISHALLALFGLVNLWFILIENEILVPAHYMYHPIDDLIPFVPQFIVPYYFWYLYQAIPMIFFYFMSLESFNKIMVYSVLAFTAACLIYTIYPNGIHLRPHITSNDFFSSWVAFTYSKDTPINSAPSLHVMMAIGMHLSITDYEPLGRHPWLIKASSAVMVIICLSTVFVKQHSILDVIVGTVIGYLLYLLIYRRKAYRRAFAT